MDSLSISYENLGRCIDALNRSLIKDLEKDISKELNRCGLFYRIFSRIKSSDSTISKMNKKYYNNQKKMQDLFGFRIVVYFNDDIDLCINLLKNSFTYIDETIDAPDSSTFKPSRINLVFRLPSEYKNIFHQIFECFPIDDTFEVQIRTVFSEGWHEVEHDLRYKCQEDWNEHPDLERVLNGLVATLETCDWSMIMLFEELAYRHYQSKNWIPMLKNKFRVRLLNYILSKDIEDCFNDHTEIAKKFLKFERIHVLSKIIENRINVPINLNNLIYITNILYFNDERILSITPKLIFDELKSTSK